MAIVLPVLSSLNDFRPLRSTGCCQVDEINLTLQRLDVSVVARNLALQIIGSIQERIFNGVVRVLASVLFSLQALVQVHVCIAE